MLLQIQLKMRSYLTSVLIRKGHFGHRYIHRKNIMWIWRQRFGWFIYKPRNTKGLTRWHSCKQESACLCRGCSRCGFNIWVRKIPGVGNGHPLQYPFTPQLQYSCLENSMDRGAWRATVYGVTKSWMQLNTHACPYQRLPGNQQKLGERHRTDSSS